MSAKEKITTKFIANKNPNPPRCPRWLSLLASPRPLDPLLDLLLVRPHPYVKLTPLLPPVLRPYPPHGGIRLCRRGRGLPSPPPPTFPCTTAMM